MMLKRRAFLAGLGASVWMGGCGRSGGGPRIVVVGGGFGGANVARALRRYLPKARITLLERRSSFLTGPFSNAVIAGNLSSSALEVRPERLGDDGVEVRIDAAVALDPERRRVRTESGARLEADYLVVSPGVRLLEEHIEGWRPEAMPAGWSGGPDVLELARRVKALPEGATVAIGSPPNPYRCPPGPYERASLLAAKLAPKKGKVLILDAKDDFTKSALFRLEWDVRYPGTVEWVPRAKGGRVVRIEEDTLVTEGGERVRPDLASIIPAQRASELAERAGLTDATGWCPVDGQTFEAKGFPGVFVLGDAAAAAPMPKSATCAHGQAQLVALVIAHRVRKAELPPQMLLNTCFSLTTEQHAISVSAAYRLEADGPKVVNSETSSLRADDVAREKEADQARAWLQSMLTDTFGPAAPRS